jgi:hypothetical protein
MNAETLGILGLSYTPKFHARITHALRQTRRIGGFSCILEDHVEQNHQEGEKRDQTVTRLPSAEARAASFSHREKAANYPKVLAAKEKSIESNPRKRKSAGLGLAAGNKAAKKQSRDIRRSENLAAE